MLSAFAHTEQRLFWSSYVFPFLFLVIALSLLALEKNWAVILNIFRIQTVCSKHLSENQIYHSSLWKLNPLKVYTVISEGP